MFKESFKYYKSRNRTVDYSHVLDLNNISSKNYKIQKIEINCNEYTDFFGLKPLNSWEVFQIAERPGLFVIKNPFTWIGQRYWIVKCLKDYSKKPNKRNIDSIKSVSEVNDWWETCNKDGNTDLLVKLRWSTLGYHHNWDTKVYSEQNKTSFPCDLHALAQFLANVLGYDNYSAEAAIINYYHMDSTLSGHTDHSEINLEAPLFSFSFGQTAVFLIGGKLREDSAIPIFLRSGDILIMAGESRLCYHGVPKIFYAEERPWELQEEMGEDKVPTEYQNVMNICQNEELWKPYNEYVKNSRVNMNVRQVLNKNQNAL